VGVGGVTLSLSAMQTPIRLQKRPNFRIPYFRPYFRHWHLEVQMPMPPLHSAARGACPLYPPSRRHWNQCRSRLFYGEHGSDFTFVTKLCNYTLRTLVLTHSTPAIPNSCCSKGSAPYWSNPLFLVFDIRTFGRSGAQNWAPERPNVKN